MVVPPFAAAFTPSNLLVGLWGRCGSWASASQQSTGRSTLSSVSASGGAERHRASLHVLVHAVHVARGLEVGAAGVRSRCPCRPGQRPLVQDFFFAHGIRGESRARWITRLQLRHQRRCRMPASGSGLLLRDPPGTPRRRAPCFFIYQKIGLPAVFTCELQDALPVVAGREFVRRQGGEEARRGLLPRLGEVRRIAVLAPL